MRHVRRAAVLLFFLSMCSAPTRAQDVDFAELDAYVRRAMDAWEVPGLALAIVKDDAVVYARGYGVREKGRPGEVDPETVFLIASTSKAFTTALLGMLVDEGRLGWDDRVIDHLPGFRLADPYVTRELTVRDLVTHRSGVDRADRLWWASPFDRDEVVRRARHLEQVSGFREGYGYNNIMFVTAGEVVEAVTGRSWDEVVRERLFEPLGMERTTTSIHELPPMDNVATPHARIEGEVSPIDWRDVDNIGAAGSINSCVRDMARWVRLQLGRGVFEGDTLVAPETLREMHAAQTVIGASVETERRFPETNFRAYGLGWFLQDYRGEKMVYHSGSLDGMRARVGLLPARGLGVVLLSNAAESELLTALLNWTFDRYLGAERDWSSDLLAARLHERAEASLREDSLMAARARDTEPSLPLRAYAGTYRDSLFTDAVVSLEDDRLVLRMGASFTGDLEHWHYDTFRAVWRDAYMGTTQVTFRLGPEGKVEGLRLSYPDVFKRLVVKE